MKGNRSNPTNPTHHARGDSLESAGSYSHSSNPRDSSPRRYHLKRNRSTERRRYRYDSKPDDRRDKYRGEYRSTSSSRSNSPTSNYRSRHRSPRHYSRRNHSPSYKNRSSVDGGYRSTSDISDDSSYEHRRSRDPSRRSPSPYSRTGAASHFVVIHNLAQNCTEDLIEERIRAISIQKGFSLPNSVMLEKGSTPTMDSTCFVEFPSTDAAARFMRTCTRNTLFVANRHCPVISPPLKQLPQQILRKALQATATNNPAALKGEFIGYRDWICPHCNYNNFKRRVVCAICSTPRVDDHNNTHINNPINTYNNFTQNSILSNNNNQSNPSQVIVSAPPLGLSNKPHPDSPNSSWILLMDLSSSETIDSIHNELSKFNHPIQNIFLMQPNLNDSSSKDSRGFSFVVFESPNVATKLVQLLNSNELNLWDKAIRVDFVSTKEKHAYLEMQQLLPQGQILTFNDLEYMPYSNSAPPSWNEYIRRWTTRRLYLPSGLPTLQQFVLEPNSGYLYNDRIRLYYDPSTQYYISIRGDYYIWDDQLNQLYRIYKLDLNTNNTPQIFEKTENIETLSDTPTTSDSTNPSSSDTKNKPKNASAIANILAAAQITAQASKDTAKVLEAVESEKKVQPKEGVSRPLTKSNNLFDSPNDVQQNNAMNPKDYFAIEETPTHTINTTSSIKGTFLAPQNTQIPLTNKARLSTIFSDDKTESTDKDAFEYTHKTQDKFNKIGNDDMNSLTSFTEKMVTCYVCIRQFNSDESLLKHLTRSEFHKRNLKKVW